MKHSYSLYSRKSLRTILIVLGSMSAAFVVGIQTAGDVQPVVHETQAGGAVLDGDLNGNGVLDIGDVHAALEVAEHFRTPTPSELAADPNRDFTITAADALAIVEKLQHQAAE